MSQLGHLPAAIGMIDSKTRTPVVSVMMVGGTIMFFSISLPLEDLAHFADIVLLLALICVNTALLYHRRRFRDLKRPFKAPLGPVLPILGILANLYLLSQIVIHLVPTLMAVGFLGLGMLGFFTWKGTQGREHVIPAAPSRVALEQSDMAEGTFRVLVPLAHPDHVERLVKLAASVAHRRDGELVALRFVQVPEQVPPSLGLDNLDKERELLLKAHSYARELGIPMTSLVRVGHHVAKAILETAREKKVDLIVLGWKGYTSTARRILGEMTDEVVKHARNDLILVKFVGDEPVKRLLLPTAGGEHARKAEEYATSIAAFNGGSITLCSVIPSETVVPETEAKERLEQAEQRISALKEDVAIHQVIIRNDSIADGIVREAESSDAVVIGAAGHSIYPQVLFGSIPEDIVEQANRTVIVVKNYHPVKEMVARALGE